MGLCRLLRYGPICFHKFFLPAMSNPIYLPAKVSCFSEVHKEAMNRGIARKETCPELKYWFHDLYRVDGTPCSKDKIDFIKKMTGE